MSAIVQMKRLNIVAAELNRRARIVVKKSQRVLAVGEPPLSESDIHNGIQQESPVGLQWDWGDDGVEAWPSMDVSLVSFPHH